MQYKVKVECLIQDLVLNTITKIVLLCKNEHFLICCYGVQLFHIIENGFIKYFKNKLRTVTQVLLCLQLHNPNRYNMLVIYHLKHEEFCDITVKYALV